MRTILLALASFCAAAVSLAATRGGDWKVVYSSSEGPEGAALEVLTEAAGDLGLLREPDNTSQHVLPLERAGGRVVVGKRNRILIGRPAANAELAKFVKAGDVPQGGYLVRDFMETPSNRTVLVAGATSAAVLWGVFDLLDTVREDIRPCVKGGVGEYPQRYFDFELAKPFEIRRAPAGEVRSLFAWGHQLDDYRLSFREMARMRLNRVILWNLHPPVNARAVVDEAHRWGLELYWVFAWGWTPGSCKDAPTDDLDALSESIVAEWREVWKPIGGDGIYFQSFTEQFKSNIGERKISEMVVGLVNRTAARIHAEAPDLDIVFGLHATSVKDDLKTIAKTDPKLEILWENCGGFPFGSFGKTPTVAEMDGFMSSVPRIGLALKGQLSADWSIWPQPAGPYMLGTAGRMALDFDRRMAEPKQFEYQEIWHRRGRDAWQFVRNQRAAAKRPMEWNIVAGNNPPYAFSTWILAEILWNTDEDYEKLLHCARLRASQPLPR